MSIEFQEVQFTAAEAAEITGMNQARQRDLRRRGFLPSNEGHARFGLYDLAAMLFIQRMAERGVGPKVSAPLAEISATGIGWFALRDPEAYEGHHLNLIAAGLVPHVIWGEEDDARVNAIADAATEYGRTPEQIRGALTKETAERHRQAEWLAHYIAGVSRGRMVPAPYFILWADGSEVWHDNVQAALDDVPDLDPRRTGPIIVLPLESLGRDLLQRGGRPFYAVRLGAPLKAPPS